MSEPTVDATVFLRGVIPTTVPADPALAAQMVRVRFLSDVPPFHYDERAAFRPEHANQLIAAGLAEPA